MKRIVVWTWGMMLYGALAASCASDVDLGQAGQDGGPAPSGDEGEQEGSDDSGIGGANGDDGANEGGAEAGGDDDGGACVAEEFTAPSQPACAAATRTCLQACTDDDACYDNCVNADPAGEACMECLDIAFIACVNTAGCRAQSDALFCCVERCSDPEADSCYTLDCGPENSAFDRCLDDNADACVGAEDVCFGA